MKFLILSRLSSIYSSRRLVQEIESAHHEAMLVHPEAAAEDLTCDVLIPRLGNFRYEESVANLELLQKSTGAQVVLNKMPAFQNARHKRLAHGILGDLPQPNLFTEPSRFPIIVKDCLSSQGDGVFLCRNAGELEKCLVQLQGREILFQEFIAESQGRDVRVFVVGKEAVASMEREAADPQVEFRSNLSLGGIARLTTLSPEEKAISIEAVRRLGLDYAGVDLVRSHRGSLILEVNPCPGFEGIERCNQRNIAKEVVSYAESVFRSHSH